MKKMYQFNVAEKHIRMGWFAAENEEELRAAIDGNHTGIKWSDGTTYLDDLRDDDEYIEITHEEEIEKTI